MKLSRKIDRALNLVMAISLAVILIFLIGLNNQRTFADEEYYIDTPAKYVTFYDNGKKLIVKTEAATVSEALSRAGIELTAGDRVEPDLSAEIDVDNFFINIYRARPVIIKDGIHEKYLMTASLDAKNIAKDAGITIYDGDVIEMVPNFNFLEVGAASVYQITRNGGQTLTVSEDIMFGEETIKDFNLQPGVSEVRQLGEVGEKKLIYEVFYVDGNIVSQNLLSEEIVREPVSRIVAVGASEIERKPLTPMMGRNRYTVTLADGRMIERQETFYDLPMSGVMGFCGGGDYSVRDDGAKVDGDGYVLVAADLSRYPRCSVVETSLGLGKVYDTGAFVESNPEQFDLATDWTNRDGR